AQEPQESCTRRVIFGRRSLAGPSTRGEDGRVRRGRDTPSAIGKQEDPVEIPAAVLWKTFTPWSVEEIILDPPKQGEVLVKLAASGLCRSDEHLVTGDITVPPEIVEQTGASTLPVIGGHEGAGEVVEVGPGVTALKPGDRIALSFIPACGRCP